MKKQTNKTLYIIVIVLVLAVVVLIIQNQLLLKETKSTDKLSEKVEISNDYVISKLSEQQYLHNLTPTHTNQISQLELDKLIEQYPAIFNSSMVGFFDVRYEGYWIIYNPFEDVIVEKIRVQGLKINE